MYLSLRQTFQCSFSNQIKSIVEVLQKLILPNVMAKTNASVRETTVWLVVDVFMAMSLYKASPLVIRAGIF